MVVFEQKEMITGPVKKFIDFCLGPDGQKIVRQTGYVPVKSK